MRTIVVHYHLFKNAGTSLDWALRQALGDRFRTYERPGEIPPAELGAFLAENPGVQAVSSHNAALPPPVVPGARIVPVLFVRHPLDRVRSIYDYERGQVGVENDGTRMARSTDLAGYVEWRLDRATRGDRSVASFQAHRLAKGGTEGTELDRALETIERLPFVGLVEAYDASIARLSGLLPELALRPARLNVTAPSGTLDERLGVLRARLGDALMDRLVDANVGDLGVWEAIRARYGVAAPRQVGSAGSAR